MGNQVISHTLTMKIVTKEQQDAAANAAFTGAAKGASVGLAVFVPGFWLASKRFPSVARMPMVQRGWLSVIAILGGGATNAEWSYERFIRSQWNDPSADRLVQAQAHEQDQWASMSPREKVVRWAVQNKYKVVIGSWAASMLGSAAFIFARNPTQTFSQKLVQCRMVAQGATVAVLIASAGLSRIQFDDDAELFEDKPEDAWKQMIEQTPERSPPLGSVHPSHAHNK